MGDEKLEEKAGKDRKPKKTSRKENRLRVPAHIMGRQHGVFESEEEQTYVTARRRLPAGEMTEQVIDLDNTLKGLGSVKVVESSFEGRDTGSKAIQANSADMHELLQQDQEVHVELRVTRTVQLAISPEVHRMGLAFSQQALGSGATFDVTITAGGSALGSAMVTLYFSKLGHPEQNTSAVQRSNESGGVAFEYDGDTWTPVSIMIDPSGDAWSAAATELRSGMTIDVPALELAGPLGWWHKICGQKQHDATAGEGISVGVADTGCGPHPYLDHVKRLGAVHNGIHDPSKDASDDMSQHGTHVCGIVGARPEPASNGYTGLAPGAKLHVIRIFSGPTASQIDISAAVDIFVEAKVDLVNLSVGGATYSAIESEAIIAAWESGTFCICSAGNAYGAPVVFPASFPATAAVTALGVPGDAPQGSVDFANPPPAGSDKWLTNHSAFLTAFSNVGQSVTCIAPGSGIISTVPVEAGHATPYAPMSGTSMASPVLTGALAANLSKDENYKALPRDRTRSQYAQQRLFEICVSLGLQSSYQGRGLPQIEPVA